MDPVTRLWLIRHGEPEHSSRGRVYGRLDVGLSPLGVAQTRRVARFLEAEPLAAVYASPRRRALETALPLAAARSLEPQTDESFREIDFGEFEGRTYDEIKDAHPEFYTRWMAHPTQVQFPGGESFERMRERVVAGVSRLLGRHAGETVALVTHGGVNRILLAEALEMAPASVFHIGQDFAAVNRIRYTGGYAIVELMNASSGHNGE